MASDSEIVQRARKALGDLFTQLGYYSFCTNAARSAGMMDIPTIGYGPGDENTAHIADEYIALDQLWGAAEGYYRLCNL